MASFWAPGTSKSCLSHGEPIGQKWSSLPFVFKRAKNISKTVKNVPFEVDWAFLTSKGSVFSRFGPPRSLENPAAATSGSRIFTKSAFGAQERSRVMIFRLLAIENRVPEFFFRLLVIFSQFLGSQNGLFLGPGAPASSGSTIFEVPGAQKEAMLGPPKIV